LKKSQSKEETNEETNEENEGGEGIVETDLEQGP